MNAQSPLRFSKHYWLFLLVGLVLVGTLIAWFIGFPRGTEPKPIDLPSGFYGRFTWLKDWLFVERHPDKLNEGFWASGRIWRVHPDGTNLETVQLPDLPDCEFTGFQTPRALPNARIGYIALCVPLKGWETNTYMMSFDPSTGEVSPLLRNPLPPDFAGNGAYAWNPDMTRAIAAEGGGGGLSRKLYWITSDRVEPVQLAFSQFTDVAWSPDGKSIAFTAAHKQDVLGLGGIDSSYSLYLMNADRSKVQSLAGGIQYPVGLTWSPDGRWLTLGASFLIGIFPDNGLWLVNTTTGQRRLVARVPAEFVAWSPDGKQLAVVGPPQETDPGPDYNRTGMYLVDVSEIVK